MDNVKLDGIATKIKWKIPACFTLYFKFWRYLLQKVTKYQFFYFLLFYIVSFYIIRYHFLRLFRTSFKIIWKRISVMNFPFLMDSYSNSPQPHIQNLPKCHKCFLLRFVFNYTAIPLLIATCCQKAASYIFYLFYR